MFINPALRSCDPTSRLWEKNRFTTDVNYFDKNLHSPIIIDHNQSYWGYSKANDDVHKSSSSQSWPDITTLGKKTDLPPMLTTYSNKTKHHQSSPITNHQSYWGYSKANDDVHKSSSSQSWPDITTLGKKPIYHRCFFILSNKPFSHSSWKKFSFWFQ